MRLWNQRHGLLDQYNAIAWKFHSSRFGPIGMAVQCSPGIESATENSMRRIGTKTERRYEGRNGWLWHTIYGMTDQIKDLELDMRINHLKKPERPNIIQRLAIAVLRL